LLSVPSQQGFERERSGFLWGLREAGYDEDRDFDLAEQYADGYVDRLPTLAKELVQLKPNVILAENSSAALAVRQFATLSRSSLA
jgi:putative ABC transport system substrate-binding protein